MHISVYHYHGANERDRESGQARRAAPEGSERCEELADLIEVIRSLAKLENKTLEDITALADEKKAKRGGFDEKIFLEKVEQS